MFPFDLLRARRRRRFRDAPPHPLWDRVAREALWRLDELDDAARDRLRRDAAVIAGEKNFEGCGGFVVGDRERFFVAAQIAFMTLGFQEPDYFDEVKSILVYPDEYLAPESVPVGDGFAIEGGAVDRLGETVHGGPVVLSWRDVFEAGRGPNGGRHLVAHEFAHRLDMRNGPEPDGNPVIEDPTFAARWVEVTTASHERLVTNCDRGGRGHLDCYGATDRAEFFAVATEEFFQRPGRLRRSDSDLYEAIREYYHR